LNKTARMSGNERAELFAETADRKGVSDAIIEKDFWVCWALKQLFSIEALSGRLLFKGGTSLSKIFHAINRFSEDIDLAVDYAALGFTGVRDPRQEAISKSKRTGILEQMMAECQRYIGGEFLDALRVRCEEVLGTEGAWGLDVDEIRQDEIEDGTKKLGRVIASLNRCYWEHSSETLNATLVGSWAKQTRVRPFSDIDIMFVLPWNVYWRFEKRIGNKQSQLLQELRTNLRALIHERIFAATAK
jgi:Second Messenger Oligonucleotide or Dinucleotide Synthetase domain